MQSKRGITIAVLDGKSLIIGVPGDTPPERARVFQMVVKETLPEWNPLVVGNGSIVDLRSTAEPELAAEAEALVARLQEILEGLPDQAAPGGLRSIE